MPKIDSEKFYTSAIEMYGTTARGVNWASQKNQRLRFQTILKLLPDDLRLFTLADAGCGFGDFYSYLLKKREGVGRYLGIDNHIDMTSITAKKTAQEVLNADICRDTLPKSDYYICSGALNVLTPFETRLFIANCYKSSKQAFIFNVLHGDKESQTYNYLTTQKIKIIAQELQVNKVVFESGYLEDDITVGFYR